MRKEAPLFVVNRLQAALFREAVNLVVEGVTDEAGVDDAVTHSIGIRWASTGPFAAWDLSGGLGGLGHLLSWAAAHMRFDEQTVRLLSDQAKASFGSRPYVQQAKEHDRRQLAVIHALAKQEQESDTV